MGIHVFVNLIVFDKIILLNTTISTIPSDYFDQTCYLCSGEYGQTQLFKLHEQNVFTCSYCYYKNWHKLSEWMPYFKS